MPTSSGSTTVALQLASLLLPSTISVAQAASLPKANSKECHGKVCNSTEEYCSTFLEGCDRCEHICEFDSHNYQADMCARECAEYIKYDPLKAEIRIIQKQQTTILILLIVLLALIAIRHAYKYVRWLRRKRLFSLMLKKLNKQQVSTGQGQNGKDLVVGATIPNVLAISGDMERTPSQIYSVTGAEGSVLTMTTPVSTRYPAENTTPTTVATEYSYDNQALAVTPVSEKPNGGTHVY